MQKRKEIMMKKNIIQKLIDEKKYFEIRKYLNDLNIVEVSELLNQFESSELIMIFRLLSKNRAADVFSYLDSEHQEMIIKTMTDVETKNIFEWTKKIDKASVYKIVSIKVYSKEELIRDYYFKDMYCTSYQEVFDENERAVEADSIGYFILELKQRKGSIDTIVVDC